MIIIIIILVVEDDDDNNNDGVAFIRRWTDPSFIKVRALYDHYYYRPPPFGQLTDAIDRSID